MENRVFTQIGMVAAANSLAYDIGWELEKEKRNLEKGLGNGQLSKIYNKATALRELLAQVATV